MGTPLPVENPGVPCSSCWGSGNPFGSGDTPKYVLLDFSGLKPGSLWVPAADEIVLRQQKLTQTVNPCAWLFTGPVFSVGLVVDSFGVTQISGGFFGFNLVFSGGVVQPCQLVVPNGFTGPDGVFYYDVAKRAKEIGIVIGEASWVLEDNEMMKRGAEVMNGELYKKYRVYQIEV